MEVRQRGLIAGFLTAALLVAPLAAEAKRAGGGKSHGMSRQAAPTQSYQQPRQATPAQQPTAPATSTRLPLPGPPPSRRRRPRLRPGACFHIRRRP